MAKVYDKFRQLSGHGTDPRTRRYINPVRIVWTSEADGGDVNGAENLLKVREEQISFGCSDACILRNHPGAPKASVLVDYGTEINGTVRVLIWSAGSTKEPKNRCNIRIRRGESVMETMAELGEKNTTNDHSNRDIVWNVGFYSANETNESGFRFMRIDLLDEDAELVIKSVNATFIFRDLDYTGSFECSDPLLNRIWDTAAYTAHLNMQEYLWDGIKRDRLVWIGDMHTEVMTILSVFGPQEVVKKSLDLARDDAPLDGGRVSWMNSIPAYSLWWILIHYQWYMATADIGYLNEQKEYLRTLLGILCGFVGEDGKENLPGKFIDWPSSSNPDGQHAGIQGLLCIALQRGSFLMSELGDAGLAKKCSDVAGLMKKHSPDPNGLKSAGAFLALAGIRDPAEINKDLIAPGGGHGFSTFMGYYILRAKALAGDYSGALDSIREYWGGMLSMGATTFWEDFNLDWLDNASPITEIVPSDKIDIHGDFGGYCYVGYRHSLCHGWASGPCPYLSQFVLGIVPMEAGFRKIRISPNLGDLSYAKGTYPTPYGTVRVNAYRDSTGKVVSEFDVPDGIEVVG